MSVTALFLLSCLAIMAQAQNCSKPVGGQNMNLKDDFILQDTFPDGSKVSFACDVGYTSAGGSSTITCTAGSWSTLRLVCERKSCGALPEVDNGRIDYPNGDTLFGDKAVVTCNQGYILVGNKEIRCGNQGWMDRLPVCEVVNCPAPGAIANGNFGPQKEMYSYSDVVRYSCITGFTLNGSRESVCSEDEKFLPGPPKCVLVECKDPVIPNAEFVEGSRPPHKYLSSVKYSCKPGYKMIGESTITCNINSQWSPGIPECKAVECKDPVIPNAEFVEGSRPPHKYSSSVKYSCKPGYKMIGESTITCNINSQWSPGIPECKAVECKDPVIPNAEFVEGSRPPHKYSSSVKYSCKPGYKMIGESTIRCDINSQWSPGIPECKAAPTPPTTTTTDHGNAQRTGIIVGVVVVLLVIIVLVSIICLKKRARRGNTDKEAAKDGEDVALS